MISVEHMDELIVRFNCGEIDIRDVIEQSFIEGRAEAIDEFAEDIINKINFEEKLLLDCKSNNADTNIMFSGLRTFVKNLKEHNNGQ